MNEMIAPFNFDPQHDFIMVAGPTASGKSALAMDIAKAVDGVIINGDSMQIYRDLSIVTACPSPLEKMAMPHRLYNALDGADVCSVGKWLGLLHQEVAAIRAYGKVPIICGGTALYLNAAQHGISAIPDIDEALHKAVIAEHREKGGAAMLEELALFDGALAARLSPGDSQRITRAIEVYRQTSRPLSDWQQDDPQGQLSGRAFNFTVLPDRDELYARINKRFAMMWEAGALPEVERLLARELPTSAPVMKAVGVPQIAAYLAGEMTDEEAIADAAMQSRRYAKRQFTFFRNNFITNYEFQELYSTRDDLEFFSKILFSA